MCAIAAAQSHVHNSCHKLEVKAKIDIVRLRAGSAGCTLKLAHTGICSSDTHSRLSSDQLPTCWRHLQLLYMSRLHDGLACGRMRQLIPAAHAGPRP